MNQKMVDSLQYNQKRETDLEKIYEEVRVEFEKRERQKVSQQKPRTRRSMNNQLKPKEISQLIYGKDIFEAIENAPDPTEIESYLKPAQLEALQVLKIMILHFSVMIFNAKYLSFSGIQTK